MFCPSFVQKILESLVGGYHILLYNLHSGRLRRTGSFVLFTSAVIFSTIRVFSFSFIAFSVRIGIIVARQGYKTFTFSLQLSSPLELT